jgi:hypothetical protein
MFIIGGTGILPVHLNRLEACSTIVSMLFVLAEAGRVGGQEIFSGRSKKTARRQREISAKRAPKMALFNYNSININKLRFF